MAGNWRLREPAAPVPGVEAISGDLINQIRRQGGVELRRTGGPGTLTAYAWSLAPARRADGAGGIINMIVPAAAEALGVTGIHAHVFASTHYKRGGSGMRMEFGPASNRWSIRYEQGGIYGDHGVFILRNGAAAVVGRVREDYGGSFQVG